jgi:hypothetical protein
MMTPPQICKLLGLVASQFGLSWWVSALHATAMAVLMGCVFCAHPHMMDETPPTTKHSDFRNRDPVYGDHSQKVTEANHDTFNRNQKKKDLHVIRMFFVVCTFALVVGWLMGIDCYGDVPARGIVVDALVDALQLSKFHWGSDRTVPDMGAAIRRSEIGSLNRRKRGNVECTSLRGIDPKFLHPGFTVLQKTYWMACQNMHKDKCTQRVYDVGEATVHMKFRLWMGFATLILVAFDRKDYAIPRPPTNWLARLLACYMVTMVLQMSLFYFYLSLRDPLIGTPAKTYIMDTTGPSFTITQDNIITFRTNVFYFMGFVWLIWGGLFDCIKKRQDVTASKARHE